MVAEFVQLKNQRLESFAQVLGRTLKPRYHYRATRHGLLLDLTDEEAASLRLHPDVVSVAAEPILHIDTERGPTWIGAPEIWSGTATPDGQSYRGEGIVIGVIDTGVNSDHPAYAEVGPVDSFVFSNPFGQFIGHCIGGTDEAGAPNGPIPCNNKLVGAWMFANPAADPAGPEDSDGHGSHTSSTTSGNIQNGPFFDPLTQSAINPGQISGVAPHANLIMYDVCEGQTCSATSAGIDQAIMDGVDVINFSISGGQNPWNDNDRLFLDAVGAGIIVAASAGNTSTSIPNPVGAVNHRGPRVLTVAASTHDRDGVATLSSMTGGAAPPAGSISGASLTSGLPDSPVVTAANFSNGDPNPVQCLNPFPAGTWTNDEIVHCDRGTIARVLKGVNVAAGGAAGLILADTAAGTSPVADFHVIPAINVNLSDGDTIRAWLASGSNHRATLTGPAGGSDPSQADVLAGFSLRGPNNTFDVTKPDITNPGVSIIAAVSDDPATPPGSAEIGFLSGTSMSSPHTAGSAALVRQARPEWSAMEVKSALQLTADLTGRREDNLTPVDPDDVGNGRADLRQAALSGVVLHETFENFLAANPANSGQPRNLNLPSMRHTNCTPNCVWTRTVRNGQEFVSDWTASGSGNGFTVDVQPASFSLLPGDIYLKDGGEDPSGPASSFQTLTITASGVPGGGVLGFGEVTLSENGAQAPDAHMTVAVRAP